MFGGKKEEAGSQELQNKKNQIEQGTKIIGNIETQGNIRIDGEVDGDIHSKSKVVLGPSCLIKGNVHAVNAEVEGNVRGSIFISELLILKESAKVEGDITAAKVHTFPGAVINGQLKMGAINPAKNTGGQDKQDKKESK